MEHHGHWDAVRLRDLRDTVGWSLDCSGERGLYYHLLVPVHVTKVFERLHGVKERHGDGCLGTKLDGCLGTKLIKQSCYVV